MNHHHTTRILRWFFLIWLGVIYCGNLMGLVQPGMKRALVTSPCLGNSRPPGECIQISQLFQAAKISLPALLIFTMLTLCFGLLLWMNLSPSQGHRSYWLSFLSQGGLVLGMATVVPELATMLLLALVLSLEVLIILRRAWLIFSVSCCSVALFVLGVVLRPSQWDILWPLVTWGLLGVVGFWWSVFEVAGLLLFIVGYLVLYMQWIRSYTQLEAAHAELKRSTEKIADLTRLAERQRLARELHDTLAQGLAGLIMQLQVANSYQAEQHYKRAQAIIQQAIQRARTALKEARLSIDDLRLDFAQSSDLVQVVSEEIRHFTNATQVPCVTELAALVGVPPQFREHALRTISEGLTNVARHADAAHVWICTTRQGNMIAIEVRDDGVGFDPAVLSHAPGHYGLLGLRERARLAGGQFEISSKPAEGTVMRLHLPTTTEETTCAEDDPCYDRR